MNLGRHRSFLRIISGSCLITALAVGGPGPSARSERILDLQFWSPERSALALGGLWEFHAQKLLEPAQRRLGSELLLEISQPWRDFQPMRAGGHGALDRGSYVLLVKGFKPRPEGYALQMTSSQSMTRVIVAPKYAPGRAHRAQTEGFFAVFTLLRSLVEPRLNVVFAPRALDEIWMIIVQRWQTAPDAVGSIPRLQFAGKMD